MSRPWSQARRGLLLFCLVVSALLTALVAAGPAFAEASWWTLSERAAPTNLPPSGEGLIVVAANNIGDANIIGSKEHPVVIEAVLPAGVEVTDIIGRPSEFPAEEEACTKSTVGSSTVVLCPYEQQVFPYGTLEVELFVKTNAPPGVIAAEAKVSGGTRPEGGAAPSAELKRQLTVSAEPTPFGVEKEEGGFELRPENEGGSIDTQAGSHPFQLGTTLDLNQTVEKKLITVHKVNVERDVPAAPAVAKNLRVNLPPGLIANVNAVEQCPEEEFSQISGAINSCAAKTVVGVASVTLTVPPAGAEHGTHAVPVFNLTPATGEPARFGFEALGVPVVIDTSIRTGGDYGAVVTVSNVTTGANFLSSRVTFWGVPGDPIHDKSRGWKCIDGGVWQAGPCEPEPLKREAFLDLPTSCNGPLKMSVEADSWAQPATFVTREYTLHESEQPLGMVGCEQLQFSPSIGLSPEQQTTNTPTALNVHVGVPQATSLQEKGLAEADVQATTITLPEGLLQSPSAVNGLEACTEEEIGLHTPEPAKCPDASKLGTVRIESPFLRKEREVGGEPVYEPVEGAIYLAKPQNFGEPLGQNPFSSLVALYIAAESPHSHVRVKLAGEVKLDENTGRVTSTFANTPQLPFEKFDVNFFGGPRAPVTTPPLCGPYETTSSVTPWSVPSSGPATPLPPSTFSITAGAGGTGCSNPGPFAPGFNAESTGTQAGAFTSFAVNIARPDADQVLKAVSVHLPTGIAGMLSSVQRCPEPQAEEGTCGRESLIGHTTAVSGLGPEPFTAPVGQVFITGPYHGAPFGLSIVTPADAGPFHLGNIVVRSTINIDRTTAALTIGTALPTIAKGVGRPSSGVALQLQRVNVTVDRPNFQFNPTNCTPLKIEATLTGVQGTNANVSSPFQVANCGALPFKPTFEASTEAKTSKANGASLKVKVTSGKGQANIGKTDLSLPIALPSRLTTIQKACAAAVFEANPASCPEGSNIGTAIVHTPALKNPLQGPAYLVSHGNAKFPDVEFVLQGEGITLVLDGETDIKKGITYSRFETLPDAPVSVFETSLPEGPHSALAANGNLCTQSLIMPTTLTGQNGAVVKQQTKIKITGCPKGLTAKQKFEKAMRACQKMKQKSKRTACQARAKKAYKAAVKAAAKHTKH
jgi:hypothetical protein